MSKKSFDARRSGTGTAEWAEVNENICIGCPNNCLYCYAAANAARFKKRDREDWHIEEFTKRAEITSYPARGGVIMFPSTHDITFFNVDAYIRVARLILEKGNKLLIVSKPRLELIKKVCAGLIHFKKQILFRFTLGTIDDSVSLFWEPGAPLPGERLECLSFARGAGFKTSVSIEPMLGGYTGTINLVKAVREFSPETIWIGKMNKARLRIDLTVTKNLQAVNIIERLQADYEIMGLYDRFRGDSDIRWKDSIQEVVSRVGG